MLEDADGKMYDFNSHTSVSQCFLTNCLQLDPQLLYLASQTMPVHILKGEKSQHHPILLQKHPCWQRKDCSRCSAQPQAERMSKSSGKTGVTSTYQVG